MGKNSIDFEMNKIILWPFESTGLLLSPIRGQMCELMQLGESQSEVNNKGMLLERRSRMRTNSQLMKLSNRDPIHYVVVAALNNKVFPWLASMG